MATSEDQLRAAVDEVLEPAWPRERRRALRRLVASTMGRVVVGLVALWAVPAAVFIWAGIGASWPFFAVTAVLFTGAAFSQTEHHSHLRRR